MGTNEAVIFARLHERYSTPRCGTELDNEAGGYCPALTTRSCGKGTPKGTKEGIKRASERKSGKAPEWAPPRLSHIFPWVLCASLPHFSGGTLCESPTFFRGTCYSNHKTRTVRNPSNAKTPHEQPDSLEIKPEP